MVLYEYFALTKQFVERYFRATNDLSLDERGRLTSLQQSRRDEASNSMGDLLAEAQFLSYAPDQNHVDALLRAADKARRCTLAALSSEAPEDRGLKDL